MTNYSDLSLWHATAPGTLSPRPSLTNDIQVDVAIVGAGYTGLWTAYYLKRHDPGIRIAIVEAEIAGFGASGRNGGWCVGALSAIDAYLSDPAQREAGVRLQRAMFDTVDEIGAVCEREAIDCHWQKSGWVQVATADPHVALLAEELAWFRDLGFGDEYYRALEPGESGFHTRRDLGGLWTAACAALHPTRLVRGLAEVVEALGVSIYEQTPATVIEPGCVVTRHNRVRADIAVRATEAYTGSLASQRRKFLPLHSMMIATEPLSDARWEKVGFAQRETFSDPRRIVIYAQRTADDRLAFGCRGDYFFGSQVRDRFSKDDPMFRHVQHTVEQIFPALEGAEITHRWGGALAIPRSWKPSVGLDRKRGIAWAGGYVGEGVAASNLAGRTLADLITERQTERTNLPWVAAPSRRWEPEPLRWLAVTAVRNMGDSLDRADFAGHDPPWFSNAVFNALVKK